MKTKKGNRKHFLVPIWSEALVAMSLGWDLAIPIFGGVLMGYYIDKWLATTYEFTIGLLVLGVAISYYNLGRFIQKTTEKSRNQARNDEDRAEK